MYRILLYIISVTALFLCSCKMQTAETGVEEALSKAGGNRKELFQVIRHYQDSGDSLKLKAALFLIENMADKYYLTGNLIDEYYTFIDSVYQIKQLRYDIPAIYDAFRSKTKYMEDKTQVNWDVQTLSADYLIENIEEAFSVWKYPWNEHLSFDEFCEWILPYRVSTEMPESWRNRYREYFRLFLEDSVHTAKQACDIINCELMKYPVRISMQSIYPVRLPSSLLMNIKFGLCNDYASLALFAMRSLGIPVAIEIVPHWGRGNMGHSFNVVYDNDSIFHDFSGAEDKSDKHLVRFRNEIPKVYRMTFSKQESSLAMQCGHEVIPDFFRNACCEDVTANYSFINAKDIIVNLSRKTDKKFAYLCVFDPTGWIPVAWGNIQENKAKFRDIGPNIVYHPSLFINDRLQLLGNPFLLDTLGQMTYFTPQTTMIDYVLERKNPQANNLRFIPSTMLGCKFQGADNLDFHNPLTYYTISEEPDFKYTTIYPLSNANAQVKYVRYLSSDKTWGNMAEVEFYSANSDIPLKGKTIGNYTVSEFYPRNGVDKLFDGDPLSFFHTNDTLSWGGLELEYPVTISKIRYLIRNDDNGIRRGHEYELFYMNEGNWQSLGKQIAMEDDRLLYKNIPIGALYWLRDYTRGREERIFEIKNDTVIWH